MNILEMITGLGFGHVTLSVLVLTVLALLLAALEWAGYGLIKLLLAADHQYAPKMDWKLKVWGLVGKLKFTYKVDRVTKWLDSDKWAAYDVGGYYVGKDGYNSWDGCYIERHCLHSSKEAAENAYMKFRSSGRESLQMKKIKWSWVVAPLAVDLSLYLLQLAFLPTVTILGTALTVHGVRKLAGMVYTNSKNIGTHKEILDEHTTKLDELSNKHNKGEL